MELAETGRWQRVDEDEVTPTEAESRRVGERWHASHYQPLLHNMHFELALAVHSASEERLGGSLQAG